jgi:hypothetical protein
MLRTTLGALLALVTTLAAGAATADPIAVGFPVLRSLSGEKLAQGELSQVPRGGDVVESRLVFRFRDGSLYDERVLFSQRGVFTLLSYCIVQRGPSFPVDAGGQRRPGHRAATPFAIARTRTALRSYCRASSSCRWTPTTACCRCS